MFTPTLPAATGPVAAKLLATFRGHTGAVCALAFSPDRCLLASAAADGSARVWDVASSKPGERACVRKPDGFRAVAFGPTGRTVALGSASAGTVWLYDVTDKEPKELMALRGGKGYVSAVAFAPDGKTVAGAGEDFTLRVWEPVPVFRGEPRALLLGHTRPVSAVAFAPDGLTVATAALDSTARLWTMSRIRSSQRAVLPHPAEVTGAAFTPDGKQLVTAARDGTARLWDATAIKPAVKLEVPTQGALALLAPDAETLVGTGAGPRALNWSLRTGKPVREWELAGGAATCAALTADGRYCARGTADGTIEVFRVAEKRA
ncbi:MAG: WD40 repeat domain-containing protein [Planctomycetes bacterium]|nr:WD40 repeat domain-containing protein [Planctomycetota bacterium]